MISVLKHKKIVAFICVGAFSILLGTILFILLEGWSTIDALHYTVSLFTTVGFGDVVATRDATKILAIVYMLLGVPMFIAAITLSTEIYYDKIKNK